MNTTPNEQNQTSPEEKAKIYQFLTAHPVGVLATVDPDGEPQASTIYFSADEDLRVRFTTKQGTRKYANIINHPSVVLVVFDAAEQKLVQISGKAVEVKDHEAKEDTYEGTLQAASKTGADNVPPIAKIPGGPAAAFEITDASVRLTEYGWGDNFANAMQHATDKPSDSDPA